LPRRIENSRRPFFHIERKKKRNLIEYPAPGGPSFLLFFFFKKSSDDNLVKMKLELHLKTHTSCCAPPSWLDVFVLLYLTMSFENSRRDNTHP
jgi:hypothetical protein